MQTCTCEHCHSSTHMAACNRQGSLKKHVSGALGELASLHLKARQGHTLKPGMHELAVPRSMCVRLSSIYIRPLRNPSKSQGLKLWRDVWQVPGREAWTGLQRRWVETRLGESGRGSGRGPDGVPNIKKRWCDVESGLLLRTGPDRTGKTGLWTGKTGLLDGVRFT